MALRQVMQAILRRCLRAQHDLALPGFPSFLSVPIT